MPQDKDKTILIPEDKALSQMHKAAAKDWEERYGILEKLLERVSEAARVLTAERTHGGYRDTRELVKKTKKELPWEPTPEPARAGWASLKLLDPAQVVMVVMSSFCAFHPEKSIFFG